MRTGWKKLAATGLVVTAGAIGCSPDKPHDYGQRRPPVDELSADDRGLQSKDVVDAADQIARELLSKPEFNGPQSATMVVTNMKDETTDRRARLNFDIFLQALKGDLARQSNGRITLIANKQEFHQLRGQELEEGDNFGQGGGNAAPAAINPDFAVTGTAMDLPNRSTNFYLLDFRVDNLKTRVLAFDGQYQVKVAR